MANTGTRCFPPRVLLVAAACGVTVLAAATAMETDVILCDASTDVDSTQLLQAVASTTGISRVSGILDRGVLVQNRSANHAHDDVAAHQQAAVKSEHRITNRKAQREDQAVVKSEDMHALVNQSVLPISRMHLPSDDTNSNKTFRRDSRHPRGETMVQLGGLRLATTVAQMPATGIESQLTMMIVFVVILFVLVFGLLCFGWCIYRGYMPISAIPFAPAEGIIKKFGNLNAPGSAEYAVDGMVPGRWMIVAESFLSNATSFYAFSGEQEAIDYFKSAQAYTSIILFDRNHVEIQKAGPSATSLNTIRRKSRPQCGGIVPGKWMVVLNNTATMIQKPDFYEFDQEDRASKYLKAFDFVPGILVNPQGEETEAVGINVFALRYIRRKVEQETSMPRRKARSAACC